MYSRIINTAQRNAQMQLTLGSLLGFLKYIPGVYKIRPKWVLGRQKDTSTKMDEILNYELSMLIICMSLVLNSHCSFAKRKVRTYMWCRHTKESIVIDFACDIIRHIAIMRHYQPRVDNNDIKSTYQWYMPVWSCRLQSTACLVSSMSSKN